MIDFNVGENEIHRTYNGVFYKGKDKEITKGTIEIFFVYHCFLFGRVAEEKGKHANISEHKRQKVQNVFPLKSLFLT